MYYKEKWNFFLSLSQFMLAPDLQDDGGDSRVHSKGAIFPSSSGLGSAASLALNWKSTMSRHASEIRTDSSFNSLFHPPMRYFVPVRSLCR